MEISNKTLAAFLVAAIAISVLGTIFSIDKMSRLTELGRIKTTTGYLTNPTAITELTINSTSSIRFIYATVNWSSGSVNATGSLQNCTLDTNNTRAGDCIGFTLVNQPLVLENDGSVNVSVAIKADKNASTLFGVVGNTHGLSAFQYNVTNNESASCVSGLANGGYYDFNTTDWTVCSLLYWDPTTNADTLRFGVKVVIPIEAPSGLKTATITATAT